MDWYSPAQLTMQLDDCDGPVDVVDALALGPFLRGAQPWARTVRLQRVRADAPLVPDGERAIRVAGDGNRESQLVEGEGWTLRVVRFRDDTAELLVSATTEALGRSVLARATDGAVEPPPPEDTAAMVGFWHLGRHAPHRRARTVTVAPWADIRRNYTRPTMGAFDRLTALDPTTRTGRLLLLHGPPGTGKTTALRSLAHAWRGWCRFDYVLDPERLFKEPGYLLSVALGEDDDEGDEGGRRWRLLILEDCDELIRSDAKQGTGQSLARLLNVTDGLLGQGLDLLVAITTNEPIAHLHPAVTRPGRCLAQIEVGRLTPAEARTWLGRPVAVGPEGATLAELYARRGDLHVVEAAPPAARVGQYL